MKNTSAKTARETLARDRAAALRLIRRITGRRERRVLRRRFLDGVTQEALAEEMNYSVRQIQRIERAALERVMKMSFSVQDPDDRMNPRK